MSNENDDRLIEILAPAKNLQYGIEAIKCGADSVYIAGEKFGLRTHFENSAEDIKKLCDFAHKYWAKVYVTLNSTIHDDADFDYVKNAIYDYYNIGADAIIISDMGILTLDLPPVPLFASVNARCFSADKINFMEKVGFSRIILPRELTFEQIKEIRNKTTVPLEVFIHGTFCVAYSGNCYFKYGQSLKRNASKPLKKYQETSSNSGNCIVNCTDIYNLLDANNNYIVKKDRLLGLRFLNLIDEFDNFITNGIHSFKIEGRQRELAYVKNITALSNAKMNEVLDKSDGKLKRLSSGTSVISFEPSLDKVYNRDFTNYFFYGRKKEQLSICEPFGNYIGQISSVNGKYFKIKSDKKLHLGDRILFYKKGEPTFLGNVTEIADGDFYLTSADNFDESYSIYRTIDVKAAEEIENAETYRYLSAEVSVKNQADKYILDITDEDNVKASVIVPVSPNQSVTKKDLLNLFNENKNIFKIININSDDIINIDNIKDIQSDLYNKLLEAREKSRPVFKVSDHHNSDIKYPEQITYLDNVCNQRSVAFYKQHGVDNIEMGMESSKDIEGKQIYTGKYCIRYELGYCSKLKRTDTPPLPWTIEDKYQNKYKIEFDCAKCEMYILY